MKKPSIFIIFLTVFIDLIGFGIVLPSLPVFAKQFNASGLTIGALIASYSAMQFLFSPVWGRLSDRVGRRPILLLSMAGSAISYAIFAVGCGMTGTSALVVLFVSRVFAGVCGANITVAQAYIADISLPEERSKKMGYIGMAFGLGFICGPILGGVGLPILGPTGPGWIAATLCAFNFVFAYLRLPESWKPSSEHVAQRPHVDQFFHTLGQPKIGLLVFLFFLATFVFSAFETTLGLLVCQNFGVSFTDSKILYLYAFCGIIGALVQGGGIGRAVKKFGEPTLIVLSMFLVAVSMAPMPYASNWTVLLILLSILSIGSSIVRPPIFGMLSILSPATEQGTTLGVAQSAGSLARIFGPVFAATLFVHHPTVPYLICTGISFIAGVIAWRYLRK